MGSVGHDKEIAPDETSLTYLSFETMIKRLQYEKQEKQRGKVFTH